MQAGRELDAFVAEKVMGWTWNDQTASSPSGSANSRKDGVDPWWWLPHYSTDIAAAWEVVDKFKWAEPEVSWSDELHCWHVMFWKGRNSGTSSSGDTAAYAICLAALKAVGEQNHTHRYINGFCECGDHNEID